MLRRRKITPTFHERMIWGQGDGSGLKVVETRSGGSARSPAGSITTRSVIYTAPGLWDGSIPDDFSSYPLWLANYTGSLTTCPSLPTTASWTNYIFWQWSSDGNVPGVSHGTCDPTTSTNCVDLDIFNGTLAQLQSLGGGSTPCTGLANGTYCGGDKVTGDSATLFACSDGGISTAQTCAAVCLSGQPGSDICLPELHRESVVDINGDGLADVCGRGPNGIECYLATGNGGFGSVIEGPALSDAKGWDKPEYGSTILFGDIDGDGKSDLCARGPSGIECWLSTGDGFQSTSVAGPALSDSAGWAAPEYYSTLQLADVNGDGKADLCARAAAQFQCWLSTGTGFETTTVDAPNMGDSQGWNLVQYYSTIQLADVNGDGKADVCGRGYDGFECWLSTGSAFTAVGKYVGELSDPDGGDQASVYSTIRMGDVNGDGKVDVCARLSTGYMCWASDGTGAFPKAITGPGLTDGDSWNQAPYFSTIQLGDIDGDGKADVCARAKAGFLCWLSKGTSFSTTAINGPALTDATGWNGPSYGDTLQMGDVNGDGKADVCGRAGAGWQCWLSSGSGFGSAVTGPGLSDANNWNKPAYFPSLHLVGAFLPPILANAGSTGSSTGSTGSSRGTSSSGGRSSSRTSTSTTSSASASTGNTSTSSTLGTASTTGEVTGGSVSAGTTGESGSPGSTSTLASSTGATSTTSSISTGSGTGSSTGGWSTGSAGSSGSRGTTSVFTPTLATSGSSGESTAPSSGCGCGTTSDRAPVAWVAILLMGSFGRRRRFA